MYPDSIKELIEYINNRKYHYTMRNDKKMYPVLQYPRACFEVLTGRGRGSLSHKFRVKLLKQLTNNDDFLKDLIKKNYHIRATKKELNEFLPAVYNLKDINHGVLARELKIYKDQTSSQIIDSLLIPAEIKSFYLDFVIAEEILNEFDNLSKGDVNNDIQF